MQKYTEIVKAYLPAIFSIYIMCTIAAFMYLKKEYDLLESKLSQKNLEVINLVNIKSSKIEKGIETLNSIPIVAQSSVDSSSTQGFWSFLNIIINHPVTTGLALFCCTLGVSYLCLAYIDTTDSIIKNNLSDATSKICEHQQNIKLDMQNILLEYDKTQIKRFEGVISTNENAFNQLISLSEIVQKNNNDIISKLSLLNQGMLAVDTKLVNLSTKTSIMLTQEQFDTLVTTLETASRM